MSAGPELGSPLSILSLREIRRYIRRSHVIAMTVTFVVLYALGSMVVGGMLVFANLSGGYQVLLILGNGLGTQPWNYPGLLILAPWGFVELPFFATLSMIVVSVGVGIGMAIAVLLGVALVRSRRASVRRPASVSSVAGLTPAMIALVTLGACCSTTAAATAGVGLVAQVSGSSTGNLLLNSWVLGAFQMVIVWVALLAQEVVLRVYGGILGLSGGAEEEAIYVPPRVDRRFAISALVRTALLVGGITWSLTMLVEWTATDPIHASAALWFRWIVIHQLPSFLAIFAALFPKGTADFVRRQTASPGPWVLRGLAAAAGIVLIAGAPPPLAGWGIEGLGNELMGVFGLPAAWGAVVPVFAPGADLFFRWGVQYLAVGGFSLAVGLLGARAFVPVTWSVGRWDRADAASATASAGRRGVPAPPSVPGVTEPRHRAPDGPASADGL